MPAVGLVRAFVALWWTTGLVLVYLGVRTASRGLNPGAGHDAHAIAVGALEALAALIFLIPRTLKTGAAVLLVVLALAFLLHAVRL